MPGYLPAYVPIRLPGLPACPPIMPTCQNYQSDHLRACSPTCDCHMHTCKHIDMSACLPAHLTSEPTYMPTNLFTCLLIPISLHSSLPAFLSTYLPAFNHVYLPISLHACLPTYLPAFQNAYLLACIPACQPECLPVFQPVYLPTF